VKICPCVLYYQFYTTANALHNKFLHNDLIAIKGSVVLHQLSVSMDLDFFIMFSSISGVLGNAGQVAYSAANSFMDQLCEYRLHKLGLPGLSVNWGPISGAGVLERNTDITSILESGGFYSLHFTTGM
jgi:hypothetical protein